MKKILIAGIGNIFHGDDAFGCEVIRQLDPASLPSGVTAIDFGVRSYDLAYALTGKYEVVILIDATARGSEPGTVFLIEPDLTRLAELKHTAVDPHSLDPVAVLQMAQSIGKIAAELYLIGCEPAVLESDELGLSTPVRQAVPQAIQMLEDLLRKLAGVNTKTNDRLEAAGKET
jgi:hydrogenase maturation protease